MKPEIEEPLPCTSCNMKGDDICMDCNTLKEYERKAFLKRLSRYKISGNKLKILKYIISSVGSTAKYSDLKKELLNSNSTSSQGFDLELKQLYVNDFLEKPSRGIYKITEKGKDAVTNPSKYNTGKRVKNT